MGRMPERSRPSATAVDEPIVETDRLRLIPLRPDDLDRHHATIGSDPAVPWNHRARSLDETRAVLRHRVGHWATHGFGFWAVEWRATGEFLGEAGLQHLEDTADVEVGYYLGRAAWGRGVATEAAHAAIRHGFEVLGLPRDVAVVRPENEGSKRVLAKLGLRFRRVADHYGVQGVEFWDLARKDWRAGH